MKSLDFALLLSKYLTQYLPAQRNLSSNTICSYRDTFKLLLIFCRDIQGFNIAKLPMTQLDRKCIEDFILWLRNIRKSSPSTCNQRLCAIHAFFDYVMVEEPQFMEQCIQIHNIPKMVSSAPPAKYLTPDALRCLLATPDITTPKGRRHLVLLTVLYDTAARVSELADIRMRDVRLDSPAAMPVQTTKQNVRQWKKPLYVWNYLALRIGSRTLILLHGFYPLAKRNILCTVEQSKSSLAPLFLGGAIHI